MQYFSIFFASFKFIYLWLKYLKLFKKNSINSPCDIYDIDMAKIRAFDVILKINKNIILEISWAADPTTPDTTYSLFFPSPRHANWTPWLKTYPKLKKYSSIESLTWKIMLKINKDKNKIYSCFFMKSFLKKYPFILEKN